MAWKDTWVPPHERQASDDVNGKFQTQVFRIGIVHHRSHERLFLRLDVEDGQIHDINLEVYVVPPKREVDFKNDTMVEPTTRDLRNAIAQLNRDVPDNGMKPATDYATLKCVEIPVAEVVQILGTQQVLRAAQSAGR